MVPWFLTQVENIVTIQFATMHTSVSQHNVCVVRLVCLSFFRMCLQLAIILSISMLMICACGLQIKPGWHTRHSFVTEFLCCGFR